jgi:hypothetical protein
MSIIINKRELYRITTMRDAIISVAVIIRTGFFGGDGGLLYSN